MDTTPVGSVLQPIDPKTLPKVYRPPTPKDTPVHCTVCNDDGERYFVIWRPGLEGKVELTSGYEPCRCRAKWWPLVWQRLGPDIAKAKPVLTKNNRLNGKTEENLLIKGHWVKDICPQLLQPLAEKMLQKGINWPFKIVTEVDLLHAVMGSLQAHRKASRSELEQSEDIRTLEAYLGPIELLILRLGFGGGKNAGIPTAVMQTLCHMEATSKPVWVIDRTDRPYNSSHPAWREDLSEYLRSNFPVVKLANGSKFESEGGLDLDGPEHHPDPEPTPRSQTVGSCKAPDPLMDMSLIMPSTKPRKRRGY